MRRALTTLDMLRAAERRLAEHRALRPATAAEAQAIADRHAVDAAYHRETAAQLAGLRPRTAFERGRGPGSIEAMHADGIGVALAVRESMREEGCAARAEMHAQAWQRVADGPEGAAYRETERALVERAAYYRARLAGGAAVARSA